MKTGALAPHSMFYAGAVGLISAGIFLSFPAHAQNFNGDSYQTLSRYETVTERMHPDYAPRGLHRGGLVISPSVAVNETYNDNIFAADTNETSDLIMRVKPSIRVKTLPKSRHDLTIDAQSTHAFYNNNTDENYHIYGVRARPTVYATRSVWFDGDFSFNHRRIARTAANASPITTQGIEYNQTVGQLSGTYKPNRVGVEIGAAYERFDFDNVGRRGGGVIIQNDRNHDVMRGFNVVSYDINQTYQAYIRTDIDHRTYDRADFNAATNTYSGDRRDSTGYSVLGGMQFDITSLMRANIGMGYRARQYDDASLRDISGFGMSANMAWNVTPLTTVHITGERGIRETIFDNASGFVNTDINVGVNHELKRNIVLSGAFGVGRNDFSGIQRTDSIIRASASARYIMNRNWALNLGFYYDNRDSDQIGLDYTRNRLMIAATYNW